tara:strand:- start:1065 stop:1559 length:495 start_codon:yes stop_codon:yes gene_type:complete
MEDYKIDLIIDPDALDLECLKQSHLVQKWGEKQAQLRYELDLSKVELDRAKAEIDSRIRKNPEKHTDGKKVTENQISSLILLDEEYIEKQEVVAKQRLDYELAGVAVKSFDQRDKSLDRLVKLFGQQYFAGPDSPRMSSSEYREFLDRSKKTTSRKLIRRKMNG